MRKAVYVDRKVQRHEPSACLSCGKILDAANGVGHKNKMRAGAITICIACGHLMAWNGQAFRELNDEEIVDVAGDERLIAIQKARAGMEKFKAFKEAAEKAGFRVTMGGK
jgi:hypothetical protein